MVIRDTSNLWLPCTAGYLSGRASIAYLRVTAAQPIEAHGNKIFPTEAFSALRCASCGPERGPRLVALREASSGSRSLVLGQRTQRSSQMLVSAARYNRITSTQLTGLLQLVEERRLDGADT